MSGSFGAGFFILALMAVLGGLAILLGLVAVAAAVRRRSGRTPSLLRSVAVALLVGVVLTAAFGVLALFDESAIGAALLLAVVFVPLVAVVVGHRDSADGWRHLLAAAGTAWSLPSLLALVTFVGLNVVIPRWFDLAPAEARQAGVGWIAAAGAGLVVLAGALLLGGRAVRWLALPTP